MKYFVFADPHGDYAGLLAALSDKGYCPQNPNHQLVGLGDYTGRAERNAGDSAALWRYLTSFIHKNKPICVRGNHETIVRTIFRMNELSYTDILNGEHKTIASFADMDERQVTYSPEAISIAAKSGYEQWIEKLPWYFETEHYIFVHGFVPLLDDGSIPALKSVKDDDWDDASWSITPEMITRFNARYPKGYAKTIVFGHWCTDDLYKKFQDAEVENKVWIDFKHKLVGLDLTTVLSHKVGVLVVED